MYIVQVPSKRKNNAEIQQYKILTLLFPANSYYFFFPLSNKDANTITTEPKPKKIKKKQRKEHRKKSKEKYSSVAANESKSVIEVIADKDSEDFVVDHDLEDLVIPPLPDLQTVDTVSDLNEEGSIPPLPDIETVNTVNDHAGDLEVVIPPLPDLQTVDNALSPSSHTIQPDVTDRNDTESVPVGIDIMDIDENSDSCWDTKNLKKESKYPKISTFREKVLDEEEQKLLQLIPDCNNIGDGMRNRNSKRADKTPTLGVRAPPRLDELHIIIEELDKRDTPLSPVDLLSLIDEWEKDKATDYTETHEISMESKSFSRCDYKNSSGCKCSVTDTAIQVRPEKTARERQQRLKDQLMKLASPTQDIHKLQVSNGIRKPLFKKYSNEFPGVRNLISLDNLELNDSPSSYINEFDTTFHIDDDLNQAVPFKTYGQENKSPHFTKASDLVINNHCSDALSENSSFSPVFDSSIADSTTTTSTPRLSKVQTDTCDNSSEGDNVLKSHTVTSAPRMLKVQTDPSENLKNSVDDNRFKLDCDVNGEVEIKPSRCNTPATSDVRRQSLIQPFDTSQITFTQALDFVHDSFNASKNDEMLITPKKCDNLRKDASLISSVHYGSLQVSSHTNEKSKQVNNHSVSNHTVNSSHTVSDKALLTSQGSCDTAFEDKLKPISNNQTLSDKERNEDAEYMNGAEFDLGFELLDDEDFDDVIPPSPPNSTQPFTQQQQASQSTVNSFNNSPSLVGGLGVKFSDKTPEDTSTTVASSVSGHLKGMDEVLPDVVHGEGHDVSVTSPSILNSGNQNCVTTTVALRDSGEVFVEVPPAVVHCEEMEVCSNSPSILNSWNQNCVKLSQNKTSRDRDSYRDSSKSNADNGSKYQPTDRKSPPPLKSQAFTDKYCVTDQRETTGTGKVSKCEHRGNDKVRRGEVNTPKIQTPTENNWTVPDEESPQPRLVDGE